MGDVPVTAPRSFFGNINAGAGAVELVASVLALHRGEIPITLNYETPDPRCPVNVVHRRPQSVSGGVALKLSQSSTGQAACLVLGPA
jgi:3-oxoacyl-[acyl-carrier-protein] synthase II